jgi:tetratricopeptide (TPR) repeat protein
MISRSGATTGPEYASDDSAAHALAAAAQARAAGAWEQVMHHADRAAAAGADHAIVTELRALALTHLQRLDDAESLFAALLGTEAYRHRAEAGLGIIALERGDDLTAHAWLDRATAAGGDADAWAALGLCLTRLAEADEAWHAYVAARTRDRGHRLALHGLIMLATALERITELETHLRDYLARVGEDADVRFALAGCLYAAGRHDESRTAVREVLRQAPAHVLAQALEHELAS